MNHKPIITFAVFLLGVFMFAADAFAYSDVNGKTDHAEAIGFITQQGVTNGYADGTFRPWATVNRAEFIKMVVLAKTPAGPPADSANDCFTDVAKTQWFSPYVCAAKDQKIIAGYKDGSFRPTRRITVAEASKILVQALGTPAAPANGQPWYSPFIEALAKDAVLPASVKYLNQNLTRGEVAEMLWRLLKADHAQPAADAAALENAFCAASPEDLPSSVNMDKVRAAWLKWVNDARGAQGLPPYAIDDQLNRTAVTWSKFNKARGSMSHKRPGQTVYYDYPRMVAWFKDLGLEFKNVNRMTFTENIGWGYVKCGQDDCTQHVIDAVRTTFDFFIGEKGKASHAHYDSLMNSKFKTIGVGLSLDPASGKYYLTVHYATAITSNPPPVCP